MKPHLASTLGQVMKVLRAYRYGKIIDLFADVNVKLRNAIAHFGKLDFGNTEISYDNSISGID